MDYLLTLKQLLTMQEKGNYKYFYENSYIEEIVSGSPLKSISKEHFNAICKRLQSHKII